MKQIVQNARSGEIVLADVPAPTPGEGQVLVRNRFSLVSPGTEAVVLQFGRKSLHERTTRRSTANGSIPACMKVAGSAVTAGSSVARILRRPTVITANRPIDTSRPWYPTPVSR